jgi:cytochrome oxidase Cu insertion factor (SCO1/SenC/PrrC family)
VPDFKLINQNGKRISLHQYRGQTLLLTLIYTRCPFPDFCPRISHEFAAIDGQVRADPARYGRTHLLSISFDPAHDTPKFCANTASPAPEAKIPRSLRIGSSLRFRQPSYLNLPIILL